MAVEPNRSLSPWSRWLVRGVLLLFAAAGLTGGIVILAYVPPTEHSFYPGCQFHKLTGWHCPGCGTTRALHALLNGRVAQALAYNPLAFILLPILSGMLIQSLNSYRKGAEAKPQSRWMRMCLNILIVLMLLYWIARNLPWYPFTLLAPHEI